MRAVKESILNLIKRNIHVVLLMAHRYVSVPQLLPLLRFALTAITAVVLPYLPATLLTDPLK